MGKYRDEFRRILGENGLEAPGSLHGWRCEHPDIYGPCDCLDGLLDDLSVVVSQIKEEAWDEGFNAIVDNAYVDWTTATVPANPHREPSIQ